MKKTIVLLLLAVTTMTLGQEKKNLKSTPASGMITLSKDVLKDKIMGGWAGQTIGVTFGGPTEFRFCGTMIQDYQPIEWYDGLLKNAMLNNPGLYDDIYMDLTFVDVFEKKGLDAPLSEFANAYANAGYALWHANQAGRYNILHGITPPKSGHWLNNPHADCIDYQIEADFAGLMSPGMPNAASEISDKIGHIMNYGDGWYGGVYMGAMYTLAFTSSDIPFIVEEGLKTIPAESRFHHVISDVLKWHKQYPRDWKATWFEIEKKYTEDIGCPEGVFVPFNIDATVNAAYVVLGLLYGEGDFTKTLEISTRAGQDSDCNPSSAGGILGAIVGYKNIPAYWKMGLAEAEPLDFKYTTMSLNDVYTIGYNHALKMIERNGGKTDGTSVSIRVQQPKTVRFEQSFEGHHPVSKKEIRKILTDEYTFDFEGIGFVVRGESAKWMATETYVAKVEMYVDNALIETLELPAAFTTRRYELFWKYQLPRQKHTVRLKILNTDGKNPVHLNEAIIYDNKPAVTTHP
ncbi:ADP-ribosylglycohydrolase family protein [Chryseolinea lacunae]|uniref:ADP-ribosylglycohydrolase family protein n=1 Tax=Chryseolinea lacunae TaxID=2801331 RepID=A0ABS1KLC3_9BACT|nr:ADP-ribosylglycohydrolase family protein [Chryseolinea lacunae]MBL0740261.1 ADP-ribosylglycohydrolase family protein [Chryseolinea lacunae]